MIVGYTLRTIISKDIRCILRVILRTKILQTQASFHQVLLLSHQQDKQISQYYHQWILHYTIHLQYMDMARAVKDTLPRLLPTSKIRMLISIMVPQLRLPWDQLLLVLVLLMQLPA